VSTSDSRAERYLRAWHRRHPDASRVFVGARDDAGRSSYERLASLATDAASVLDIACGTGALLSLIQDIAPAARLAGIDLSEPELGLAVNRLPNAYFAVARSQALPIRTGSIDVVVCHMALMLMDHPAHALAEIRRVLRPGGRFGAIVNRAAPPDAIAKTVLKALRPAWERAGPSVQPPPLGDSRVLDADALTALVGGQFDEARVDPFDVVRDVPRENLWAFLVDSLYGLDAIDAVEANERLDAAELPDPVRWTIPMAQAQGRAR